MNQYLAKVLYILTGSKKKLLLLLSIFVFTSIVEAIGIGLIGPFLSFAANPEYIHQFALLDWIYQKLNLQSSGQFILILAIGIAALFCFKAGFYFLAQRYIVKFSFRQKSLLRSKLLNAYLNVPYTFYLKANTANIIKNTILETNKFCWQTLLPLLEFTANLVLICILLLLLAKTDLLLLTLTLLVLAPVFWLFFRLRKKMARWGKKISLAEQEMIRTINHGLGGIKETRVIGCEAYFERQMDWECQQYEQSIATFSMIQKSPRILIEIVLIIFILFFVSFSQVFFQQDIEEITSILAVFLIAAMRLIPAASNLINNMGKMQNSSYALDVLCLDLKAVEELMQQKFVPQNGSLSLGNNQEMTFNSQIEIDNLTYAYPDTSKPAIENISLKIKRGESVALIGKSGAGKTTLVDLILALLEPQIGDILVDGVSIYDNLRSWQQLVGYIPQSIHLLDDTIEHNIAFGVEDGAIDAPRMHQAIATAQLSETIEQLPQGIHTLVGEQGVRLSGGQRQRIGIARALYHQREILVLDEATSALDNETERLVSDAIKSLAGTKTLIIIAHRLSTIEHCDRVYVLERGNLVKSGKYQEVCA